MPPEDTVEPKAKKAKPVREVRMVPSALFFSDTSPVPAGIRARDISPMVQGMVEEHSPIPVEQTSWGFLLDNRSKKNSQIFYFAAPRELVFKNSADASDLAPAAVLPGIACLQGISFKKPTWIFLQETDCLTAALFEPGTNVPSKMLSRFLEKDAEDPERNAFELRSDLIRRFVNLESEEIVDGVIRMVSASDAKSKGIQFQLEQCLAAGESAKPWKKTELRKRTRMHAADVRQQEALEAESQQKNSGQRILQIAAIVLVLVGVLAYFEYLQYNQQKEAVRLSELAEQQKPTVERLQEIEAMNKSLKSVFQNSFSPYRWLMVINEPRPPEIYISSYSIDNKGELTANGSGPQLKTLNTYLEALRQNVKLKSVNLSNVNTDKDGVNFTLSIQTGDIDAEPPAPEPPAPPAEAAAAAPAPAPAAQPQAEGAPQS